MTGTHCRVIIDAVALIDFLDSNPSVLRLISDHLGRLAAVYEVVCEVDRKGAMSPPEALSIGTGIHEVNAAYITDEVLAEFRRLIGHEG